MISYMQSDLYLLLLNNQSLDYDMFNESSVQRKQPVYVSEGNTINYMCQCPPTGIKTCLDTVLPKMLTSEALVRYK